MEVAVIKHFFSSLAERLNHENDLSDITYSLCNSNEEFRRVFLKYCFEKDIDTRDFYREYAQDDSRPDFQFHDLNGKQYILEVKIYDKNQHFLQYMEQFPNAKFAFIANYEHNKISNWKVKTWKGFYTELIKSECYNDELVVGYAEFVKKVINYKEIVKMNFNNIDTLTSFIECLKEVSESKSYEEYNSTKSFCESYYGKHFSKENMYYWFGLYIPDKTIYLGFKTKDKTWVPEEISLKLKQFIGKTGTFFDTPQSYPDGNYGDLFFPLKKEYNQKFLRDLVTLEEQKEIIQKFYDELFQIIEQ